jgi:hypothetical protein
MDNGPLMLIRFSWLAGGILVPGKHSISSDSIFASLLSLFLSRHRPLSDQAHLRLLSITDSASGKFLSPPNLLRCDSIALIHILVFFHPGLGIPNCNCSSS